MAAIYVNLSMIRDANYDLPYMETKTDYIMRRLRNIKREIPDCISDRYRIGPRLGTVCKEMEKLEARIGKLYEVTNLCIEQYAETEYENSENAKAFY